MRRPFALLPLLALAACGGTSEPSNMSAEEVAGTLEQINIEPGLWEVVSAITDVRGPNLPYDARRRMVGPRATVRHCIMPEQASRPSAGFLAGRDDDRCAYRDFSMKEGLLRGTMSCPGERGGMVDTEMLGRYGPEGYVLRMEMHNPMPDGSRMRVIIVNRGNRVGPCDVRETQG
jgi:hypothetical protein